MHILWVIVWMVLSNLITVTSMYRTLLFNIYSCAVRMTLHTETIVGMVHMSNIVLAVPVEYGCIITYYDCLYSYIHFFLS